MLDKTTQGEGVKQMMIGRKKLHDSITSKCPVHVQNRAEFNKKLEKQKDYTLKRLAAHPTPLSLLEAARISGGFNLTTGNITLRFRVVVSELVAEGKLVETRSPHDLSTYRVASNP